MVYLMKCANDEDVNLQVRTCEKFVDIRIEDKSSGETQFVYLNEEDLFQLIGVLHYIKKQLKK